MTSCLIGLHLNQFEFIESMFVRTGEITLVPLSSYKSRHWLNWHHCLLARSEYSSSLRSTWGIKDIMLGGGAQSSALLLSSISWHKYYVGNILTPWHVWESYILTPISPTYHFGITNVIHNKGHAFFFRNNTILVRSPLDWLKRTVGQNCVWIRSIASFYKCKVMRA